jgi:hypothetical protein
VIVSIGRCVAADSSLDANRTDWLDELKKIIPKFCAGADTHA